MYQKIINMSVKDTKRKKNSELFDCTRLFEFLSATVNRDNNNEILLIEPVNLNYITKRLIKPQICLQEILKYLINVNDISNIFKDKDILTNSTTINNSLFDDIYRNLNDTIIKYLIGKDLIFKGNSQSTINNAIIHSLNIDKLEKWPIRFHQNDSNSIKSMILVDKPMSFNTNEENIWYGNWSSEIKSFIVLIDKKYAKFIKKDHIIDIPANDKKIFIRIKINLFLKKDCKILSIDPPEI